MSEHSAGQRRAFSAACLKRGFNETTARTNAEAIYGKPFSEFTFEEMDKAIRRINNQEAEKVETPFERWQEEKRLRNAIEDADLDRAIMAKYSALFGDDFESTIAPILYSVRRPSRPEWILPFIELQNLPTLEERRSALFELMASSLAALDLEQELSQDWTVRPLEEISSKIGFLTG